MTSKKNNDKKSHAGLTVAHSLDDFVDGQERILVLKDSTILENEEEGDQLVSVQVEEDERLRKNLENKKKKPVYSGYDDEEFLFTSGLPQKTSLLPQYDEVIDGDKKESFKISEDGTIKLSEEERRKEVAQKLKGAPISLEYTKFKEISDYYTKDDKVEFKKPKTKKKKRVRKKTTDEDRDESVDVGDDEPAAHTPQRSEIKLSDVNFVDDDDLQAALARARSSAVKKLTNLTYDMDIDERTNTASVLEAKAGENLVVEEDPEKVISQTSEFLKSLPEPASEKKIPPMTPVALASSKTEIPPEVVEAEVSALVPDEPEEGEVNMQDASMQEDDVDTQEDEVSMMEAEEEESIPADGSEMKEKPNLTGVVEEEPLVSGGMAATLALLKQKGYNIKPSKDILEKERRQKEQQKWLVEQRRKEQERLQEREREKQRTKEKGYRGGSSGRDSESSYRDREHLREIEARFKDYKPDINLEYVDEYGNQLTPKEEFRQLSHKFHGKSSGKAKTEKRLKKMEEQRKLKAMSSVDTPLNMATALQERQRATGSAHVVLSVGNRAVVPSSTLLTAATRSGALSKSSSTSAANVITVNGGLTGQSMNAPEREKVTFGLKRKAEGDGDKPTTKKR